MSGVTGAEPDKESMRRLLASLKELPPKVRTDTRRQLRRSGDDIIAAQKAILDQPLPAGIQKAGWRFEFRVNKKTGKRYVGKRNIYKDRDVANSRSKGRREGIKAGLKLQITATAKTQQATIRTTGPKVDGSPKFNFAKIWNKSQFRHPVFGLKTYVDQRGQPFFSEPIATGSDELVRNIESILTNAFKD